MLKQAYENGYRAAYLKLAAEVSSLPTDKNKPLPVSKPASPAGMSEHPQTTPGGPGKGFTAAQSSGISPGVAQAGLAGLEQSFGR